ncbi:MAG TPA: DUF2628 domain-containing protein [Alphaproteobacteria bacterium]|nr:DUF2628 domain-containing protein [Alphaproteobacteria bacterium]
MTLYSVFDRRRDEAPAVVPDRFSWFAGLLPPLFAIVHGLWLELVGYVVLLAAIGLAATWLGEEAGFWLYALLALWIGFEAPALRRRALRRSGYIYRSELIAAAPDLAEVEWLRRRSGA